MLGALKLISAAVAGIGLLLSFAVHVLSYAGATLPEDVFQLHIGLFIVWVPAVIASFGLTREFKQKDFWRAALRGVPPWMRYVTYATFGYAIVNFVILLARTSSMHKGAGDSPPPVVAAGFSGHWMAFYAAAMAVLYSSYRVARKDPHRRCSNGHLVSNTASFCEVCGAALNRSCEPPGA